MAAEPRSTIFRAHWFFRRPPPRSVTAPRREGGIHYNFSKVGASTNPGPIQAAILAGNWINRLRVQRQVVQDFDEQRKKLKTLIAAELVTVAIGLIDTKESVDSAVTAAEAGGLVTNAVDLTLYRPRPMPSPMDSALASWCSIPRPLTRSRSCAPT